jgi:hypothetical protein
MVTAEEVVDGHATSVDVDPLRIERLEAGLVATSLVF